MLVKRENEGEEQKESEVKNTEKGKKQAKLAKERRESAGKRRVGARSGERGKRTAGEARGRKEKTSEKIGKSKRFLKTSDRKSILYGYK